MIRPLCRHLSFLMVLVILTISVLGTSRCASACASHGAPAKGKGSVSLTKAACCAHHESSNPDGSSHGDSGSVPDHSDCSFECPCHAALMMQPIAITCSPIILSLQFSETFRSIPEVYLPTFVPPHILA